MTTTPLPVNSDSEAAQAEVDFDASTLYDDSGTFKENEK